MAHDPLKVLYQARTEWCLTGNGSCLLQLNEYSEAIAFALPTERSQQNTDWIDSFSG